MLVDSGPARCLHTVCGCLKSKGQNRIFAVKTIYPAKPKNARLDRKSALTIWMGLSPPACMVETWPPVWWYWKGVEPTTLRPGTDFHPEPHCLQQRFAWSSRVLAPVNAVVGKCGLSLPWLSAPSGGLAHTPNSNVHDAVHHSRRQSPNRWGHPTLDFPPSKMWAEYTAF